MARKKSNKEDFTEIISILKILHTAYPNQGIARHISDATVEYKNIWGIENKELLFLLRKYKEELEMNIVSDSEVDKIVSDAKDLSTILDIVDEEEIADQIEWE